MQIFILNQTKKVLIKLVQIIEKNPIKASMIMTGTSEWGVFTTRNLMIDPSAAFYGAKGGIITTAGFFLFTVLSSFSNRLRMAYA